MARTFRMSTATKSCSTRERGRKVYPALLEFFRAQSSESEILVVSFEGVELVTPSFLDETIVQLVRDEPRGKIRVMHVPDYPVQSLTRMLEATGKHVRLERDREGTYLVAAA